MLQYCTGTKILCFKSPTATSVPSPSWAYPLVSLPSTLTLARIYELLVPGLHPEGPMQGLTGKPKDWCLFFLAGSDREHREQLPWQPNTPYPQAGSNATPALSAWKPLAQRRRAGASPPSQGEHAELHTQSIHLPVLGFGPNLCYKRRFHRPAAIPSTTRHVRVSTVTAGAGCPF